VYHVHTDGLCVGLYQLEVARAIERLLTVLDMFFILFVIAAFTCVFDYRFKSFYLAGYSKSTKDLPDHRSLHISLREENGSSTSNL